MFNDTCLVWDFNFCYHQYQKKHNKVRPSISQFPHCSHYATIKDLTCVNAISQINLLRIICHGLISVIVR